MASISDNNDPKWCAAWNRREDGFLLWLPGTQPDTILYASAEAAAAEAPHDGFVLVWLESCSVSLLLAACIVLGEE